MNKNLLLQISDDLSYIAFAILKGSRKIALIKLNIPSMVIPIILKGSNKSQTRGNRKIITIASGQQITKSKHHRTKAIKVLIEDKIVVRSSELQIFCH